MPKFSDKLVAALNCPAGRKDALFFDGELRGFGLRVTSAGTRTFIFQYRAPTGVRRMPIGTFGTELTTAQARAKAERLRGEIRDGRDPVAERTATREAAIAANAAAKAAAAEVAFTVRELLKVWDEKHLSTMRESYRQDAKSRLNLHLVGMLDRPASSITRAEVVRQLDRIAAAAGPTTARRVMGYARSAWGWTRKRGAIAGNPFEDLPSLGREVSRDRVLDAAEIGAIWNAAGELGGVHGGFARFLLLTLCRREEAARMTWGELSADGSRWTLPAERAKNRSAHVVQLAPAARAVIDAVPKIKGNDLVFAVSEKKGLSAFSFIAKRLGQPDGDNAWRLHDFRRTGVTVLAGMGFPPHICDKLLNHVGGTINGVAAVYQRQEFLAERKAALEAWAAYVIACAEGRHAATNVVPIRAAG
jgi:integrase